VGRGRGKTEDAKERRGSLVKEGGMGEEERETGSEGEGGKEGSRIGIMPVAIEAYLIQTSGFRCVY
jgi:hypothetical protein